MGRILSEKSKKTLLNIPDSVMMFEEVNVEDLTVSTSSGITEKKLFTLPISPKNTDLIKFLLLYVI